MINSLLSHEDNQCLSLGRQILRMIRDLKSVVTTHQEDTGYTGYARQRITFPSGYVHVFVVNDDELATKFEEAAAKTHEIQTITPPSQIS